jgi:acyl carrier protein
MSMSKQKVQAVFREIFQDGDLEIYPEMTARDVENWDSFNHINLIIALEEAIDTRFSSEEIGRMAKVGDLFEILKAHGKDVSWQ